MSPTSLASKADFPIHAEPTHLFGHSVLGNADFEVVHFAFHFYGFKTYNALVNPSNPLVRTVLTTMVESGDYFCLTFFRQLRLGFRRNSFGDGTGIVPEP